MPATLRFWFEFASPYSWLAAMRIEAEADRRGVTVTWQPFLLGPIFADRGWPTSPFLLYPDKGRYMWRDVERQAEKYGLTLRHPDRSPDGIFPQNSLLAARLCLVGGSVQSLSHFWVMRRRLLGFDLRIAGSCSCISGLPTGFRRCGAGGRRPGSGRICRPGTPPRPAFVAGSRA